MIIECIFCFLILQQSSKMKRNSIKKASNFKLQAAKSKFCTYLSEIDQCTVARKFPHLAETIKETSENVFEFCYNFREGSPFIRGLNYNQKTIGFSCSDNIVTYNECLPNIKEAYLMGEFNGFSTESHKLVAQEQKDWFTLEIDINSHYLAQSSKIMLRIIDHLGVQSHIVPPCCHIIKEGYGIFMKNEARVNKFNKFKIFDLLAYTIDLSQRSFQQCREFVEKEAATLECYNTIILKNLFANKNNLLYRFSLSPDQAEKLSELINYLNELGLKTVIEWNFEPSGSQVADNPIEKYFIKKGENGYMYDLSKENVMSYYLANISYFYKTFCIGGIHFTNVQNLCKSNHDLTLIKCINMLSERLSEDAITLASSKEVIPGLTQSILEGGLGFSYTYNHHQSMEMKNQHCNLYELASHIHSKSNCLSVNFQSIKQQDYIYLLFTFLISKSGVFTCGPFTEIREHLQKILKLRRQEQLFNDECKIEKSDSNSIILIRGRSKMLFNFSSEAVEMKIQNLSNTSVLFNETEQEISLAGERLKVEGYNCILLEDEQKKEE